MDRYQFEVLSRRVVSPSTQREIAESAGISLGSVNKAVKALRADGMLNDDGTVSDAGVRALAPYKVRGAVILAAGVCSRFAPLSFERPKALYVVRGEVLIERLVRQLREAGIDDITIVVGYMKEAFFYLESRCGVRILVNPEYAGRNNHSSVWAARDMLANALVCSSDQYYAHNPFKQYEYESIFSLIEAAPTDGQARLARNASGRIVPAQDGRYVMEGPAYLSEKTARGYLKILEREYGRPTTIVKPWKDILVEHLDELPVATKLFSQDDIHEFAYISDLRRFDQDFFLNVDSKILDNICSTLACERTDIVGIDPLKAGLTNLSVLFEVRGCRYIYRHPGPGTNQIVNRKAEAYALSIAKELGFDETFVYEDPEAGWKISRYVPDCVPFDYQNQGHVAKALGQLRRLHASGRTSPWSFDFHEESKKIAKLLEDASYPLPADFEAVSRKMDDLAALVAQGAGKPVLCHNDFYGPNLLVRDDLFYIIDWEYSAMGDYGCDIGNFVAQGSGYTIEEAEAILPYYFGRAPSAAEVGHCMGCTALVGWYWYVWAMYKECQGNPMGDWLYVWYKSAQLFGEHALGLFEGLAASGHGLGGPIAPVVAASDETVGPLTRGEFNALVERQRRGVATAAELDALEPYRAKRAVLLASGFGSRLRPVTVNTPKPLVRVNGRRIIESILDALLAVGIDDVVIVRGYHAEEFDILLRKYPYVKFVDNLLFDSTNNISSAVAAGDSFRNAYVFESDLFLKNPDVITRYQYRSNYMGVPVSQTKDWCFDVSGSIITDLHKGGEGCCHMYGISYWDEADGRRLCSDLARSFEPEENRQRFWDDVPCVICGQNYHLELRPCSFDDIAEIDTFEELCEMDPSYRV